MIPVLLKLRVPRQDGDILTLYLPLFLLWLILIPILIVLLPFILIGAVFAWNSGYGRFLVYLYPLLFDLLVNLKGLKIDIQSKKDNIYISFI